MSSPRSSSLRSQRQPPPVPSRSRHSQLSSPAALTTTSVSPAVSFARSPLALLPTDTLLRSDAAGDTVGTVVLPPLTTFANYPVSPTPSSVVPVTPPLLDSLSPPPLNSTCSNLALSSSVARSSTTPSNLLSGVPHKQQDPSFASPSDKPSPPSAQLSPSDPTSLKLPVSGFHPLPAIRQRPPPSLHFESFDTFQPGPSDLFHIAPFLSVYVQDPVSKSWVEHTLSISTDGYLIAELD
jgi:hypothetical protein